MSLQNGTLCSGITKWGGGVTPSGAVSPWWMSQFFAAEFHKNTKGTGETITCKAERVVSGFEDDDYKGRQCFDGGWRHELPPRGWHQP